MRIGQFRSHCAGWTHLRGLRWTPSTLDLFWTKAVQAQTIVFIIENNRIQLRKDQWCVRCMRGFSWIKRTIIQRSWFCPAARSGRRKVVDSQTELSVIEALDKLKLSALDGESSENVPFDFKKCKDYVRECAESAPKKFENRVKRDNFAEALIGSEIRNDVLRRPRRQKMEVSDAELSVVAGR